jgi:predicted nucleic acid-binding protein
LIVLDASALLEILLQTRRAERLMQRALAASERIHAPELLDIEAVSALRRLHLRNELSAERAAQALEDLSCLAIQRHAHGPLLGRIWELRDAMTAYDAAYVVLAEALDAPLLTCDGRLARAHGHGAKIELIDA